MNLKSNGVQIVQSSNWNFEGQLQFSQTLSIIFLCGRCSAGSGTLSKPLRSEQCLLFCREHLQYVHVPTSSLCPVSHFCPSTLCIWITRQQLNMVKTTVVVVNGDTLWKLPSEQYVACARVAFASAQVISTLESFSNTQDVLIEVFFSKLVHAQYE